MNPIDSEETKLRKDLKFGSVVAECECSFILVTYPPKELDEKVLNGGFPHRFCWINKFLTLKESMANAYRDAFSYKFSNEETEKKDSAVLTYFNILKNWVGEQRKTFKLSDEAVNMLSLKQASSFATIEHLHTTETTRGHLEALQRSVTRKIVAIASHNAALKFSTIISKEDIEYGFDIVNAQMETIKVFLETSWKHGASQKDENIENERIKRRGLVWISENKKTDIPKSEFGKLITDEFKWTSSATIANKIDKWIKEGIIIQVGKQKEAIIKFLDVGEVNQAMNTTIG